jgi:hypothetical protein
LIFYKDLNLNKFYLKSLISQKLMLKRLAFKLSNWLEDKFGFMNCVIYARDFDYTKNKK